MTSPPPPPPSSAGGSATPKTDRWFPYRNAGDFDTNLATILIVLVCALICALSLHAAIRYILRRRRDEEDGSGQPRTGVDVKPVHLVPAVPALVYSSGMRLAGAEAECAICLSEFVDGERVRVLPKCKHGFHDKCIEGWLSARPSCPTCRTSCLQASPEKPMSDSERSPAAEAQAVALTAVRVEEP